jgi:peptidyl-prolyl cis-trans isomerase A (cyclophilin A)
MRTLLHTLVLIISTSLLGAAQAASTPPANTMSPAHKPAPAAGTDPIAIIHTSVGDLHCTLFPKIAPLAVANFIGLATGTKDWTNPVSHAKKHGVPLYDGTIFHRVIPDFMIQGGDPAGTGEGDPGYQFKNETSPSLTFDRPGRLAYANSGPDTNGSQFFITEDVAHSQHLSGSYSIFGQCDDAAVELVKQIARMSRDPSNDRPFHPVKITHIEIRGAGASAKPATAPKPAAGTKAPAQ